MGRENSKADSTLYLLKQGERLFFYVVCVGDINLTENAKEAVDDVSERFKEDYEVRVLERTNRVFKMPVKNSVPEIKLHDQPMIEHLI